MTSLTGQLLIASPRMADPNFSQAVVLLVTHSAEGALGLVLNRRSDTTVAEAWQSVADTPCLRDEPIHIGGPCHGPLMAVHTQPAAGQLELAPGLYFTGDEDDLQWLIEQGDRGATRFFVGYAGWSDGQLDCELETGDWLVGPGSALNVFDNQPHQWSRLTQSVTSIANLWPKLVPPDPSVN